MGLDTQGLKTIAVYTQISHLFPTHYHKWRVEAEWLPDCDFSQTRTVHNWEHAIIFIIQFKSEWVITHNQSFKTRKIGQYEAAAWIEVVVVDNDYLKMHVIIQNEGIVCFRESIFRISSINRSGFLWELHFILLDYHLSLGKNTAKGIGI